MVGASPDSWVWWPLAGGQKLSFVLGGRHSAVLSCPREAGTAAGGRESTSELQSLTFAVFVVELSTVLCGSPSGLGPSRFYPIPPVPMRRDLHQPSLLSLFPMGSWMLGVLLSLN